MYVGSTSLLQTLHFARFGMVDVVNKAISYDAEGNNVDNGGQGMGRVKVFVEFIGQSFRLLVLE